MVKTELISRVAESTGLPKSTVKAVIDSACDEVTSALRDEGHVSIASIGSLKVVHRAEKPYVSPSTGEVGITPAHNGIKFSAASALKTAVN